MGTKKKELLYLKWTSMSWLSIQNFIFPHRKNFLRSRVGRSKERLGKEEEEGHSVVRGRWAQPPMEGKGPREGQRMAISQ